jgi:rod shape-determining protein MreD
LIAIVFTLFKGKFLNFFGLYGFEIDLITIILAYLFLYLGSIPAVIFAFSQGFLIDVFSGGIQGLFAFIYLIALGGIFAGCLFFNLQEKQGCTIIILLAVLLERIAFLILLNVFVPDVVITKASLGFFLATALLTGFLAPPVFYLLDRLKDACTKFATEKSQDGIS